MRAHNPNGTSIGSAAFAQTTAECLYCLQWFACFPLKIVSSHVGIWTSRNIKLALHELFYDTLSGCLLLPLLQRGRGLFFQLLHFATDATQHRCYVLCAVVSTATEHVARKALAGRLRRHEREMAAVTQATRVLYASVCAR